MLLSSMASKGGVITNILNVFSRRSIIRIRSKHKNYLTQNGTTVISKNLSVLESWDYTHSQTSSIFVALCIQSFLFNMKEKSQLYVKTRRTSVQNERIYDLNFVHSLDPVCCLTMDNVDTLFEFMIYFVIFSHFQLIIINCVNINLKNFL